MHGSKIALIAGLALAGCASQPEVLPFEIASVPAVLETAPMTGLGDRADDPAIWVNPDNAARSLILGTNKQEGLHVYDLQGAELQFLPVGQVNNVDVRGAVAVASNDETEALSWFAISRDEEPTVTHLGDTGVGKVEPYGVCLGEDEAGLIAAATYKDGTVQLWRAQTDAAGNISADLARTVKLETKLEGCVFDESQGLLFIGEEAFGIWSVEYANDEARPRVVDRIADSNGLVEDTEGLSIWWAEDGGYLVASAQAADRFVVYDRLPPHAPRGIFTVTQSEDMTVDGVSHTDGLDVVADPLPGFPNGLLVVQDDANPKSEVDQNFKLVDWTNVQAALDLE